MKVLIVDDVEVNRKLLRANFRAAGYATVEAGDGAEALALLKKGGIKAVVSDILMPAMDGYSLCRAVRADPALRNLPFIIYTSTYISPGDEGIAKTCGADRYLRKPAEAKEAVKTVTDMIGKPRRAPAAKPPPSEKEVLKQYSEMLVRKLEDKTLELHERNKKLQASEHMFRQLLENLEQVFYLHDAKNWTLLYVSPSFAKIWGRDPRGVLADGAAFLATVVPEDRPTLERHFGRTRHDGRPIEYRIARPDGAVRWIRSRTFPILAADGSVERLCGMAEDITGQKDTESQLQQAQKMESIGRLAGGVAHDFNNVLTAINGYAEFLLSDSSGQGEQWRSDVREILVAAKRASALTSQLLSFSRKQRLQPRVVSLNDSVRGLDKMLRRLIGEDVRMELRCTDGLGSCKADPGQLEQVVMNLAVNARDAMPQGGTLVIGTEDAELDEDEAARYPGARPGPYVRLYVSDTGSGMTDEVMAHLFEPFFTTKEKGKGTGLGLSTVYGIVQQSEGFVQVTSRPGRGSRFDVLLPRLQGAEASEETAAAPAPRRPGTELPVLLVEDDESVRPVTRRMLTSLGYQVLVARDGLQALEVAQTAPELGVALVDMVMPGASGAEVLACLRERYPGLKFVCMSGYTDREMLDRALTNAVFLQKPFTQEALAAKIAEALRRP